MRVGHLPDEIDYGAVPERSRAPSGRSRSTQVILELTGGGALDGPVSELCTRGAISLAMSLPRRTKELDGRCR